MKNNSKFTKGEWKIGSFDNLGQYIERNGKKIATIWNGIKYDDAPPREEAEANAKLIAAAPNLYEACEALCEFIMQSTDAIPAALVMAKMALKKANPTK